VISPLSVRVGNAFTNRKENFQPFDWRSKLLIVRLKSAELVVWHDEEGPPALTRFTSSKAANHVGMIEALCHFDLLEKAGFAVFPGVV
jgi:hypothetical protein